MRDQKISESILKHIVNFLPWFHLLSSNLQTLSRVNNGEIKSNGGDGDSGERERTRCEWC